jgi:beta-glucosidase
MAAVVVGVFGGAGSAQAASCPWMKPGQSPDQRASELIGAMTLDQKINQLHQSNPPWFIYWGTAGHVDGTPSLCIPTIVMSDAGSGVAGGQQGTTTFPSGIAQAATWNPLLEHQFGEALGQEAYDKGINVMLGPGMDTARIATNGRNFEYFGEDPFLAGTMVASAIRGVQSNPVLAQAKHFAANDQETDRNTVSAIVDQRTLREIYLAPFEAAVKQGHVGSIMCSYNRLNDVYACQNKQLLEGYLRHDWGFDGFVTSDWGATHSTVDSAMAGLDIEMNATPAQYYGDPLKAAVQSGKVPMARLNLMLRQVFLPMFRFGLFDHPVKDQPGAYGSEPSTPEHRALARRIAEEATVLLKNDPGTLPLSSAGGKTIGVLGYAANPVGASNTSGGGGSSKDVTEVPQPVSPLEGIEQQAAAHGDKVLYADGSSQADATAVAKASDVVIAFAADTEQEGSDRPDLGFRPGVCPFVCGNVPLDQDAMIDAAAAANPNTVVVIAAGAPVAMPWLGAVKAVVDQWYAGIENGNAIAAILYGQANPSGKLPQTFPKSLSDMPTRTPQQYPGVGGKAVYSEGLKVGYRWFDSEGIAPLFPFGYGLSYTTFAFSHVKTAAKRDHATVSFTLRNTGPRRGADVSQVYVGFPSWTGEPPHQLKGFEKADLESGASKRITVDLTRRAFSYWNDRTSRWRVGRGCYSILVGDSSRNLPLHKSVPMGGGHCTSKRRVH